MRLIYENKNIGSYFEITDEIQFIKSKKPLDDSYYKILWNRTATVNINVDGVPVELKKDELMFLSPFQYLENPDNGNFRLLKFNKEFYCIQQHDNEVSCIGFLFYGASGVSVISLDDMNIQGFEMVYKMFIEEFSYNDNVQGEMLTALLKRLIIKSTRLGRQQILVGDNEDLKYDIIRFFNLEVEIHFKNLKKVKEYADKLNKSPKTLSNTFAKLGLPSPSQIINNRIILEAKRLFLYTDNSDKEIAFELGYDDASNFSRFFKSQTGESPREFREKLM